MRRLLWAEFKRAVCARRFFLAAFGYGVLLCLDVTEYWNDSAVYNFQVVFKTAFYLLCFVCAALPFADSFLRDVRNGAWRNAVIRSGLSAYCAGKPIAVFLSGFCAVVLGSCLFVGYLLLIFPLNNDFYIAYSGYDALLNEGHCILYLGVKILLTAWSSATLAVLSLSLSGILKNTYAVLAAPVLLYYLLNELGNYGLIPLTLHITRMLYAPLTLLGGYACNILFSIAVWSAAAFAAGLGFFLWARRNLKNA